MKRYFAYIRVSTTKQGERGSSLQEQKSAIEGYAARNSLTITQWFEEMETAASQGRTQFTQLMKRLSQGHADGLIVHKIDRSARNLKDWSMLGDLIDRGIDVHFAHESLDMHTRGGRLSADIQAVVAADYIRNLRDEVKKGFYGRLKQGLYPLPAPLGYLDRGKGLPKIIDPITGPLVREAFELYVTGAVSLTTLREHLAAKGLKSRYGTVPSINTLSLVLQNPFYIGTIRLFKTNETFEGKHEPLIPISTFKRVQAVLKGRDVPKTSKHQHQFRQLLTCTTCKLHLSGELQKGRVYYRCHRPQCRGASVREDALDAMTREVLSEITFNDEELKALRDAANDHDATNQEAQMKQLKSIAMRLEATEQRLFRLTDALLDGVISREDFNARKAALIEERTVITEAKNRTENAVLAAKVASDFELQNAALQSYEVATPLEKRDVLNCIVSNFWIEEKCGSVELRSPFREIADCRRTSLGAPCRGDVRTLMEAVLKIQIAHAHGQDSTEEQGTKPREKALVANAGAMNRRQTFFGRELDNPA